MSAYRGTETSNLGPETESSSDQTPSDSVSPSTRFRSDPESTSERNPTTQAQPKQTSKPTQQTTVPQPATGQSSSFAGSTNRNPSISGDTADNTGFGDTGTGQTRGQRSPSLPAGDSPTRDTSIGGGGTTQMSNYGDTDTQVPGVDDTDTQY